ncbi:hypothetical protein PV327_003075 [Microctonus hyperodae]|uniref:NTF2-related export protein n=1 Tax=Microctonus hyperodae TaxID=165561 RepID=A0AA39G392_MICHY|nr:hypothetical protein PV327_003075 [Microctonus hyperodae]
MEQNLQLQIDQACNTAEAFTKLYYQSLDKKRYAISRLYLDTATLIWNGNDYHGKEQIQKFWVDLPISHHFISTLDAQPVTGAAVADQLTFLVKVSGQVKYQDKVTKPFNQTFLIAAMGEKWKIVSDCFRMQEAPDNST